MLQAVIDNVLDGHPESEARTALEVSHLYGLLASLFRADASADELVTNELDAPLRQRLVVFLRAALIGEAVELDADLGHRGECRGELPEPLLRRAGKHRLVGAEQQIHRDARLHQPNQLGPGDTAQALDLDAERVDVGLERTDGAAGRVEGTLERLDLFVLAMERIADLGADGGSDDEADRAARGRTYQCAGADADDFLLR